MKVRIGSRESRLAVIQSEMVRRFIEENNPGLSAELVTMKTTGDKILDRTLDQVGGKGLFVKELDRALMDDRTDLSVHSLKDLPMEVSEDLPVVAWSKREDERDVLVLPKGEKEIDLSKPIGTSSLRRALQIKKLYPGAEIKSVRGNVITRLEKLDRGDYGALVLAAAGMIRMGFADRISRYFTVDEMIPAAGQGILAVQGRSDETYEYLKDFNDREGEISALAERAFVRRLNGGCSSPVAAHAVIDGTRVTLTGLYFEEGWDTYETDTMIGEASQCEQLGTLLAERFLMKHGHLSAKDQKPGRVFLVGAGPGDVGLFTLKGAEVLKKADVVVYDALVGDGVLSMVPKNVRRIDVGKRSSHHTLTQDEINEVLLREAQLGHTVVRLKGGDPFLFGRGGEELELLSEHHIPFEIVPGITSPIAVPAYNGIPVTHRAYTSSVTIITGHQKAGKPLTIDFEALTRLKGTICFLMGIAALPEIMKGLLAAGMDPAKPCAVLSRGTTARQAKRIGTISTMEQILKENPIATPAIIVVGDVCSLSDQFSWYEKMPLAGKKILVTRPEGRGGKLQAMLREQGAEVIDLPAIKTTKLEDESSLEQALTHLDTYDWIAFTSPYGVSVFFEVFYAVGLDVRKMAGIRFAVIGEGTRKELMKYGICADLMPETYDGGALGRALAAAVKPGENVLIPRAKIGNAEIIQELSKAEGISIEDLPIYDTTYETGGVPDAKALVEAEPEVLCTFTSASCVRGFVSAVGPMDYTKIQAVCIGRQTAAQAEKYGMQITVSEKATLESLVEKIMEL